MSDTEHIKDETNIYETGYAAGAKDSSRLRYLLALHHGCDLVKMYVDDGELQCPTCGVDFKRDPVAMIEEKFERLGVARMAEFAESDEGKKWIEMKKSGEIISDGFGSSWSAYCSRCKKKSMVIIRPGDAACSSCGN